MDLAAYRIVQEALTNCLRHTRARQAQVRLRRDQAGLHIDIDDDDANGPTSPPAPGHGLLGLQERVQALGGTLQGPCPSPGGGLVLQVWLPLPEEAAALAPRGANASAGPGGADDAGAAGMAMPPMAEARR